MLFTHLLDNERITKLEREVEIDEAVILKLLSGDGKDLLQTATSEDAEPRAASNGHNDIFDTFRSRRPVTAIALRRPATSYGPLMRPSTPIAGGRVDVPTSNGRSNPFGSQFAYSSCNDKYGCKASKRGKSSSSSSMLTHGADVVFAGNAALAMRRRRNQISPSDELNAHKPPVAESLDSKSLLSSTSEFVTNFSEFSFPSSPVRPRPKTSAGTSHYSRRNASNPTHTMQAYMKEWEFDWPKTAYKPRPMFCTSSTLSSPFSPVEARKRFKASISDPELTPKPSPPIRNSTNTSRARWRSKINYEDATERKDESKETDSFGTQKKTYIRKQYVDMDGGSSPMFSLEKSEFQSISTKDPFIGDKDKGSPLRGICSPLQSSHSRKLVHSAAGTGEGEDRENIDIIETVTTGGKSNVMDVSKSKSSKSGKANFMDDNELISMLKKKPKRVKVLRTRESFQDFFSGMAAKRMHFLLTCAFEELPEDKRAEKISKRLSLVEAVLR